MDLPETHGNRLGWVLDQELGTVAGVRCAVLVSGDGLLHSHTNGLEQEYAEKLAAIAASLRASSLAMNGHVGGGGVRQHLAEFTTCCSLTMTAANNSLLSVITTDPGADVGLIATHMVRLVSKLGHEMEVEERLPGAEVGSPA